MSLVPPLKEQNQLFQTLWAENFFDSKFSFKTDVKKQNLHYICRRPSLFIGIWIGRDVVVRPTAGGRGEEEVWWICMVCIVTISTFVSDMVEGLLSLKHEVSANNTLPRRQMVAIKHGWASLLSTYQSKTVDTVVFCYTINRVLHKSSEILSFIKVNVFLTTYALAQIEL